MKSLLSAIAIVSLVFLGACGHENLNEMEEASISAAEGQSEVRCLKKFPPQCFNAAGEEVNTDGSPKPQPILK